MFLGAPTLSIASPTRSEGVDGVGPNCPGRGEGRLGGVEGVKCGVGREDADARLGPDAVVLPPTGPSPVGCPPGAEVDAPIGWDEPIGGPSTTSAMVGKPFAVAVMVEGEGRRSRGTSGDVGDRGDEEVRWC